MTIVVDASIALKWVLEEPGSDAAEELLENNLAAPSLWVLDAANALWRRTVLKELTQAEAVERLVELTKAPVASVRLGGEGDFPDAMRLALQLNHPVYDCLYLALAKRMGKHAVAVDTCFGQAVAEQGRISGTSGSCRQRSAAPVRECSVGSSAALQ